MIRIDKSNVINFWRRLYARSLLLFQANFFTNILLAIIMGLWLPFIIYISVFLILFIWILRYSNLNDVWAWFFNNKKSLTGEEFLKKYDAYAQENFSKQKIASFSLKCEFVIFLLKITIFNLQLIGCIIMLKDHSIVTRIYPSFFTALSVLSFYCKNSSCTKLKNLKYNEELKEYEYEKAFSLSEKKQIWRAKLLMKTKIELY